MFLRRRPTAGAGTAPSSTLTSFDPTRKEVSAAVKTATPEVKRMNMNVPKPLHDAFKAATAARGENMTDVLLKHIEEYVKKYGTKMRKERQ